MSVDLKIQLNFTMTQGQVVAGIITKDQIFPMLRCLYGGTSISTPFNDLFRRVSDTDLESKITFKSGELRTRGISVFRANLMAKVSDMSPLDQYILLDKLISFHYVEEPKAIDKRLLSTGIVPWSEAKESEVGG